MLSTRRHWRCKWCNTEFKGGVTRLKQYLAGGYPDVSMCRKYPQEVRQLMKKHFADSKAAKESTKQKKIEVDRRAAEPPSYHSRESEEASAPDDEEAQIEAAIHASLTDQYQQEEMARYRDRFGPSCYESGSGSATSRGEFEFRRTTSVREPGGRGSRRNMSSLLGAFGSRRRSSRDIPAGASIQDLDPHALPSKDSKQQRIDSMLKKDKKKDMWRAIGSWFHFSHIPANAAANSYYRSAISAIEAAGQGVDPTGPKDIYGQLLDSNKEDLQRWIASYKNKWPTYGLTVMCDGWTGPTRRSIINFLTYCDGKIFFYKSIDASDKMHDATYILGLMKEVIDSVGEQHVVQIITDNGPQYKAAESC
ncbi:uncharacterized protein [Elaeis guineensis]|uniref:uncharacterized protein n=1 Tax=Elaeis guineensis var. tenera TaxID=51953 RepID=UPI003C6D671E